MVHGVAVAVWMITIVGMFYETVIGIIVVDTGSTFIGRGKVSRVLLFVTDGTVHRMCQIEDTVSTDGVVDRVCKVLFGQFRVIEFSVLFHR